MLARRRFLVIGAAALAAVDLVLKALDPVARDPRGVAFAVLAVGIAAGIVVFVPRIPSRALTAGGAFAAAGAAANALSAVVWHGGVPNPFLAGGIAFNVADLYAVVGAMALVGGAIAFAIRNPSLLRQSL
ncbi:MAG TPA: hypothetical protein VHV52_11145 [Gaiellaceae bacterium]|nr:hypothetical protein [Gaiellaceae bacterium]